MPKYKVSGTPIITFSLPGGRLSPWPPSVMSLSAVH